MVAEDNQGKLITKIADFGFSSCALKDNEQLILPGTLPWNAPEVHEYSHLFTYSEAIKTDVFSVGMLCLWLLNSNQYSTPEDRTGYMWLSDLKNGRTFIPSINSLLDSAIDLCSEEKENLRNFFACTLVRSPTERNGNLAWLTTLFGSSSGVGTELLEDDGSLVSSDIPSQAFFKVSFHLSRLPLMVS